MASAGEGELTGRQLGDYLLEGLLGGGGMAEVYRARDLTLGREVAVKVLPAYLAHDPGYVRRFREEAQRVAGLQHPHIVPVFHYSEQDPLLYLVMPILMESLRDRMQREERLDPVEAIRIVSEMASALQAAHEHGLVHRDVKPENILLDTSGTALLTDFGIAREASLARQGGTQTLTGIGLPVGTPEYMAPEQLRNEGIDARADIYALGAVLYELLAGRTPHQAPTPYEVAALALMTPITPPAQLNPAIWPALEEVVMKALAPQPADRFQSAAEFSAALSQAASLAGTDLTLSGKTRALVPLGTLDGIAAAPTVHTNAVLAPAGMVGLLWTSRRAVERSWRVVRADPRWWAPVAGLVALLALALVGGGDLLLAGGFGTAAQSPTAPPGGTTSTFVGDVTATTTSAPATPTGDAQPTATAPGAFRPTPTPTPRPTPTFTRIPPPLSFSPAHLINTRKSTCTGQEYVQNNSTRTLGWTWKSISLPKGVTLSWNVNPASTSGLWPTSPPQDSGMGPGGFDTVSLTMNCVTGQYTVTVQDSAGNTYQFQLISD